MTKPSEQLLLATEEVNRAQRERWTNEGPRQYQEYGRTIEAGFAPFGLAMFDAARLRPGERVLDLGAAVSPQRSRRPTVSRLWPGSRRRHLRSDAGARPPACCRCWHRQY